MKYFKSLRAYVLLLVVYICLLIVMPNFLWQLGLFCAVGLLFILTFDHETESHNRYQLKVLVMGLLLIGAIASNLHYSGQIYQTVLKEEKYDKVINKYITVHITDKTMPDIQLLENSIYDVFHGKYDKTRIVRTSLYEVTNTMPDCYFKITALVDRKLKITKIHTIKGAMAESNMFNEFDLICDNL